MDKVNQKMVLEVKPIAIDITSFKIPRKGEIKPSRVKTSPSGLPNVDKIIQVHTSTNYMPGRIRF